MLNTNQKRNQIWMGYSDGTVAIADADSASYVFILCFFFFALLISFWFHSINNSVVRIAGRHASLVLCLFQIGTEVWSSSEDGIESISQFLFQIV